MIDHILAVVQRLPDANMRFVKRPCEYEDIFYSLRYHRSIEREMVNPEQREWLSSRCPDSDDFLPIISRLVYLRAFRLHPKPEVRRDTFRTLVRAYSLQR
jgi:hypothetical protein